MPNLVAVGHTVCGQRLKKNWDAGPAHLKMWNMSDPLKTPGASEPFENIRAPKARGSRRVTRSQCAQWNPRADQSVTHDFLLVFVVIIGLSEDAFAKLLKTYLIGATK